MARCGRCGAPYPYPVAENSGAAEITRAERTLAFMSAGVVVISSLALFVVLVAPLLGVRDFGSGIWPALTLMPAIGFPIGFLLMLTLLLLSILRRRRDAQR